MAVVDIRIMATDGHCPLPAGEVGELWVAGPNVAYRYWARPAETAEAFIDGYVRTGDLARVDEDGFLYIVDRAKDIVIRGGENIYCIEIENCLYEYPGVADVAVVGAPHRTLGEVPVAVVQASGVAPEALIAHCEARLAPYKVPVAVVLQNGPLPRNASGKLLKPEIAQYSAVLAAGSTPPARSEA